MINAFSRSALDGVKWSTLLIGNFASGQKSLRYTLNVSSSEPSSWFERFGEEKDLVLLHAVKPRFLSPSPPSLITIPAELLFVPASDLSFETGIFRCLWYYSDVHEISDILFRIRQRLSPSISFPVNYAIINPTFSCVNSEV